MAKTREELMQYAQREYRVVDGARLQTLTELELVSLRSRWGERYNKTKDVDLVMRRELVVACLVDDDGHRLSPTTKLTCWLTGTARPLSGCTMQPGNFAA